MEVSLPRFKHIDKRASLKDAVKSDPENVPVIEFSSAIIPILIRGR